MLDSFEILTASGVVLWSRSYAPVSSTIINSLINDVFIEAKTTSGRTWDDVSASQVPPYKKDQYTLKWTTAKDLKLIFVVNRRPVPISLSHIDGSRHFTGRLSVPPSSVMDR